MKRCTHGGRPAADARRGAARTARPATPRRPAPRRQRRAAGLFRRRRDQGGAAAVQGAQSRSCWCSGRAIPTARSTIRATASNELTPGINGPTSLAADQERRRRSRRAAAALDRARPCGDDRHHRRRRPRLLDHLEGERDEPRGARPSYKDVPKGFLPPGFLAIDLAKALGLPLFDPDAKNAPSAAENAHLDARQRPDRHRPGQARRRRRSQRRLGSRLSAERRPRAGGARSSTRCSAQDYVSGLFVDDALGSDPRNAAARRPSA